MYVLSKSILAWAGAMFGEIAYSKDERAKRFFEEACELIQAADITEEQAMVILRRAFSRPKDLVFKEVGGTFVTLLAFCAQQDIVPEVALSEEFDRIMSKPLKHWRDKHNAKIEAGTTSGATGE